MNLNYSALKPDQVTAIAKALDVPEQDVVSMNHRLSVPDDSLNVIVGDDTESEWQDWLADERDNSEVAFAEQEETGSRSALLAKALTTLKERERHILTKRRLMCAWLKLPDTAAAARLRRRRSRPIPAPSRLGAP